MIRIAVSVLNYNSAKSTIDCVKSLLLANQVKNKTYLLDIYVSDNASSGDDPHQLQRSFAELTNVHFRENSINLGFAGGHNCHLKAIFARSNPDYIWLLNNDCVVLEETPGSLIKCAEKHPDVGIWGATLLDSCGEVIQCAGGCFYNSWISSYQQYGKGKSLSQIGDLQAVAYDYIAGASLFFPAAVLKKGLNQIPPSGVNEQSHPHHWLNEDFFLYFEELDLAQRLDPAYRMAWCKSALIKHVGGTSTGTNDDQRTRLAEYHSALSALKFTRLYYPARLWFMAPARYFSKCVLLVLTGKFELIGVMTKAYRDFRAG
jgi:GT2 family glycosyltransferase